MHCRGGQNRAAKGLWRRGEDAAPWLVTPRITREDLEPVDGDYRYVVE